MRQCRLGSLTHHFCALSLDSAYAAMHATLAFICRYVNVRAGHTKLASQCTVMFTLLVFGSLVAALKCLAITGWHLEHSKPSVGCIPSLAPRTIADSCIGLVSVASRWHRDTLARITTL